MSTFIYFFYFFSKQHKKPETPLNATNPFLEDEAADDLGSEKDEDLNKVS